MKTKSLFKYTLAVIITVGSISSCKDYLELNPISSAGPDYIFSSVENATKAVVGAYSKLSGDQGYGIRVSMYYPYDNDEMMNGQGLVGDGDRRDIAHYNTQPSNGQLAAPFKQLYAGIENANICIHYIPLMDNYNGSDKSALHRLHGEALTLRAQFYFELIRNWGDLPAQWEPSSFESDLFKEKTDRDEIYDHIIADLAQAADLVPWRSEVNTADGRITQGAVRALRARIALFRGGYSLRRESIQMERRSDYLTYYQIARDECNTIIQKGDHKLNPSFQAVFKDALDAHVIEPNGEVIWEAGMTGGGGTTDSKLGYYNGPQYITSSGSPIGNAALYILPTLFYSFDANDTRRDVSCAPYNVNQDGTVVARKLELMTDGKFRRDWIKNPDALTAGPQQQYFGVNWPLIRYSDVLLMFAEADNELNQAPTAAAISAFEQVRLRAFGGNASLIGTTPTDYTGFFNAIINERSFELSAEGHRKYDLIRWNKLEARILKTIDDLTALQANTNLPTTMYYKSTSPTLVWMTSLYAPAPGVAPVGSTSVSWVGTGITTTLLANFASNFTVNKSELFPIPTEILQGNPKLTQDYNYQ